jgi:hypothetical protein
MSTTDPTLRSRISSAIAPTGHSGGAVTTVSVMTSRICIGGGESYTSPLMAQPSPTQLAWRQRVEAALALAAPALDLLLAAGDRLSRTVEREDLDWVPPRRALPPRATGETPRT